MPLTDSYSNAEIIETTGSQKIRGVSGSLMEVTDDGRIQVSTSDYNALVTQVPGYFHTTFGETRNAQAFGLADYVNKYGLETIEFGTSSLGAGSIVSVVSQSGTRLSVGASNGDFAKLRTHTYFRYQAGHEQNVKLTCYNEFSPRPNQQRRWGLFDNNNGMFFGYNGTSFGITVRSSAQGSLANSFVSQSDWNIDKLDGTGISGFNLNPDFLNIYEISFAWLGTGKIRWFVNGHLAHEHTNFNQNRGPYISNATLPVSVEVENTGSSTSGGLVFICSSVDALGGHHPPHYSFAARNDANINVGVTPTAVLAIRPGLSFKGVENRAVVLPKKLTISTDGARISFRAFLNSTITGGTWVSASAGVSCVEYNRTITSFSGGEFIFQGFLPGTEDATTVDLSEFFDILSRKLLRRAFDLTSDTLLVTATNEKAGTTLVKSSIIWDEVR